MSKQIHDNKNNSDAPRILVVDDDRLMRTILSSLLRSEGYTRLEFAQDGNEALQIFLKQKPEIVFLDIEMPGSDGIQTLHSIMEHGINTQVVMISGYATTSRVEAAANGGAAGFLVKPITQNRLVKAIEECLKRADHVTGDVELFIFS